MIISLKELGFVCISLICGRFGGLTRSYLAYVWQSYPEDGRGLRTFSWRLNERIIIYSAPRNDNARWTCTSPRRWPRPRWSSTWVIRPGSAWSAGWQRIPDMPAIWRNPSSHWRRGPRRSNWCRAACSRSRPPNCSARASARSTTGSRRIARAVWPRCGPKTGTPAKPTSQRCDGIGTSATPRRCAGGLRSWNWGTR